MSIYTLGFSGLTGVHAQGAAHNPAAALLKDGRFVAGAGEERFNRIKASPGLFPHEAIRWVLDAEGIELADVSAIAWANDPLGGFRRWRDRDDHRLARKAVGLLAAVIGDPKSRRVARLGNVLSASLRPHELVEQQRAQLVHHFGAVALEVPFECVDHHLSHAASAYYPSGLGEATVITWDGSGDELSGSVRHARQGRMSTVVEYDNFSIGGLYWAVHTYLKLSDEGSLMGLAAYGQPNGALDAYVRPAELWMDLAGVSAYHRPLARHIGYDSDVLGRVAPPRTPDGELGPAHRDLAAELQDKVEGLCFEIVRRAVRATHCKRIALAGGVALNAVFNGKLGRQRELCEELFVQPNPGDEGGSLGAAYVAATRQGLVIDDPISHAYFGPRWSARDIEANLKTVGVPYRYLDDEAMVGHVSAELAAGRIVAWFQGPLEWGPRALGNRSVLADPRDPEAGARVNRAVKYRDAWRPFAPSLLAEAAGTYLEDAFFSPFMITTFVVRPDRRSEIPSVVHADGTTRPQMVTKDTNLRYYELIRAFGERTGTPVLLNTSFNLKGEPIVNTPLDALRTFFSSGIDLLVMENHLVVKGGA